MYFYTQKDIRAKKVKKTNTSFAKVKLGWISCLKSSNYLLIIASFFLVCYHN